MGKARIHENLEESRSIAPKRKLEEEENDKDTTKKQITEPITEIEKEKNKKQVSRRKSTGAMNIKSQSSSLHNTAIPRPVENKKGLKNVAAMTKQQEMKISLLKSLEIVEGKITEQKMNKAVTVAEKITQQEQTSIDDEMEIDEKTNGERQNREENEQNPANNQENLETRPGNTSKQNDLEETLKQRRKYIEGVKNDDHMTHEQR